ncbi:MAG: TIM barrel protein [Verrucomicrobiota bacterium]|jgi:inosose dehydratase
MSIETAARSASKGIQSRRKFLGRLGAMAALGTVGSAALPGALAAEPSPAAGQKTLVGSNIYGWGQYAQRDNKKLDVAEVISALRDTGYDYLENFMDAARPEENARFADQLRAKGLQPVSLYTGARLHQAGQTGQEVARLLAAAKVCRQAGFAVISCNPDPIGRDKTEEELKTQAAALEELGEGLEALGLKLGVHNHTPEMANQAREFHYNFDHTKPEAVGFCYDVHWVWKGGVQPLDALRQYGRRVVTWHLRQSRQGIWWEDLDTGDIDYAAVAQYAKTHELPRRFTVELALETGTSITRSAIENHRRSREFVRKVFGN